jgi:hypothetical protein
LGDVIDIEIVRHGYNQELEAEFSIEEDERRLARKVRLEIEKSDKVQGKTRLLLAKNLGKILSQFGRELSRDELACKALVTTNIKPSERLGRFQIKPGKKPSDNAEKRLSKNPKQYLKLAETAAELTGNDAERFILELVDATRFDPKSEKSGDIEDLAPIESLHEIIRTRCEFISEKTRASEYVRSRKEYRAVAHKKKHSNSYSFETEMTNFHHLEILSSVNLYSIAISNGTCEWREEDGPWIERPIEFVENVNFEIRADENGQVFGAFRITPSFYIHPQIKGGKKRDYYRDMHAGFPKNIKNAWLISSNFFLSGISLSDDGEKLIPTEGKIDRECKIWGVVRLPKNHKLNLTRHHDIWLPKITDTAARWLDGSNTTRVSPIVDKLSIGSVSKWMDIPIDAVRRMNGDAYRFEGVFDDRSAIDTKFDASRGVSPPSSMLAEIEVSLFYEGQQGSLDAEKDDMDLVYVNAPGMVWENEDGEVFEEPEQVIDKTYVDNFLDILENDITAQSDGFFKWRREVRKEGQQRSNKTLEELDEKLRLLREAREKDDE